MHNKLQELTEKIYKEGVSKGNDEAEKIIENARQQAKEITDKAKADAEKIHSDAEKQAKELKENMTSEIRMSSQQALNALKQEISEMIQTESIKESADKAFTDQAFINEVITVMAKNWDPDSGNVDLTTILPADKQEEVEKYFSTKAKELLDKGLTLKYDDKLDKGFEIGPKDGSYTISFTDADFEAFIKEFLRPRVKELLFESQEKK